MYHVKEELVYMGVDIAKAYLDAAQRMWLDIVERKMYVTGGVGSTGNEGFGEPYSLPNISAYSETCAALMFITLNHRLFMATGDSRYIDVMERAMYNNAVDGVSMAGRQFFYVNRLASAGDGRDARWERASNPSDFWRRCLAWCTRRTRREPFTSICMPRARRRSVSALPTSA